MSLFNDKLKRKQFVDLIKKRRYTKALGMVKKFCDASEINMADWCLNDFKDTETQGYLLRFFEIMLSDSKIGESVLRSAINQIVQASNDSIFHNSLGEIILVSASNIPRVISAVLSIKDSLKREKLIGKAIDLCASLNRLYIPELIRAISSIRDTSIQRRMIEKAIEVSIRKSNASFLYELHQNYGEIFGNYLDRLDEGKRERVGRLLSYSTQEERDLIRPN